MLPLPDSAVSISLRVPNEFLLKCRASLYELGEISGETIFIDGTKIEACANKYTFVWKKSVSKKSGKVIDENC